MEFSRQEYWCGLPFPSPGDLPGPEIKSRSPTLWADSSLSEPPGKPPDHQGSPFNKYFDGKVGEGKLVNCHSNLILLLSNIINLKSQWGFPGGTVVKNPPANVGDAGLMSGLGRFPGAGNGNPLQYSCLRNPMNRGYSPQGCKELDVTEQEHI